MPDCPEAGDDRFDSARHLRRGTPREGQQQDAARINSAGDQAANPVRQGAGLARPRAGNDQQRKKVAVVDAVAGSGTLIGIETTQQQLDAR